MAVFDNFFFAVLPYIALIVFIIGAIYKYKAAKFKYTSLSSEFLERRKLFWGSIPFHIGILFLFFGHLAAFIIPAEVLAWNSNPVRLLVLEITAFIFGLSVLFGLVMLFIRRVTNPKIKIVTSRMDIIILVLLLIQVILGLWVAYFDRWGSSWFAAVLTPYLYSIFTLQPDIVAVSALPHAIKFHIIGAYLIVLLIPFSRLVHFLVPPIEYLWRPYQQVIWNWRKTHVRNPNSEWTTSKPKNN